MKQQAIEMSRDWLTLIMTGLGISFAAHEYIGGLFLALAVGSMIARHRRKSRNLFAVMGTSALVATLAVIGTQEFNHFGAAPQLIMAAAGAASGWTVTFLIKIMDRVEERGSDIADRFVDKVLPDDNADEK